MKKAHFILIRSCFLLIAICLLSENISAQDWKQIFDGKTLKGWSAPDMSYFKVEDGAITGATSVEHNPPYNQFIVWKGGTVQNFELKFKFRVFGAQANSGMQFRGTVKENGLIYGYQADIGMSGVILGSIYDEYGPRYALADRGQKNTIDKNGKKTITQFADPSMLIKDINLSDWNEYHIIANGSNIQLKINGKLVSELDDMEEGKAASSGVLGMPIIPGEPMKIQYKDIMLKVIKE